MRGIGEGRHVVTWPLSSQSLTMIIKMSVVAECQCGVTLDVGDKIKRPLLGRVFSRVPHHIGT